MWQLYCWQTLAQKILKLGCFWPTIKKDSHEWAEKCDKCQRFTIIPQQPPALLCPVLVPWPFSEWGVDIICKLPIVPRQYKHAIVEIDYFIKLVEAEPLAKIIKANMTNFTWKNMIFFHCILALIITENGSQFNNVRVREICAQQNISTTFSSPRHHRPMPKTRR